MLTAFGDSRSGNCLKVKWMLDITRRDYQWIETDVTTGSSRTPEFLAKNPAGQVPLLILDDGRPLAQSNAIILWIGEGGRFVPTDAYDRARMMEWLFWEQYSHEPYVAVVRFQRTLGGKSEHEIEPRLMERGHAALARMEMVLSGADWLVGTAPTLADLALVAYTRVAHEGGFAMNRYPAIQAWILRVEAAFAIG
ncbi:glutathione S-transferase family protein [Brevundimonas sp.]